MKKAVALILALMLCFLLTACGGEAVTEENIANYVSDYMAEWFEEAEGGEVVNQSTSSIIRYTYAYNTALYSLTKDANGEIKKICGAVRLRDIGTGESFEDALPYMMWVSAVPASFVYPGNDIDEMTSAVLDSDNAYEESGMLIMYIVKSGWEFAYYIDEGSEYVNFDATRIN
ncbi:MAG: hypothetical protein IKL44_03225 [Clostridia bacterium]|nr:hypothetical protein [Clostridia bacterium]